MLYRGRGLRPYSIYERRRNPRYIQDIAFQPVEAEKDSHSQKEAKIDAAFTEGPGVSNSGPFRETVSDERFGNNSRCPHICKVFNIDLFLDDLILIGLIFLLLQDGNNDYIFIFALIFLFLIGKE